MSTQQPPAKVIEDQEPAQVDDEDEGMRYDDAMCAQDEHTALTPEMEKMLEAMLAEEATKLGEDQDGDEIVADFKEKPFDEEEFMSHIILNDEEEVLEEMPTLVPATTPNPKANEQKKQPQQQPKQQPQQQQQKQQPKPKQQKPKTDDDGFTTVGKSGKAKRAQDKDAPKGKQGAKGGNQQQQPKQQPQKKEKEVVHRIEEAEIRPQMPGKSEFPFCFACATRHDFDECKA